VNGKREKHGSSHLIINVKLKINAMKRIILIALLIAIATFSTYARKFIAGGQTYTALGDYKVELADEYVIIDGLQHKPYIITYANTGLEVKVVVTMDRNTRKYYVLSDNLSVQYVSTRNYFGVQRLDKELEKDGYRTSDAALNREEYFHQKVITGGDGWKKDKTPLIAAYFPMLLNNPENILAQK
jgi:hypothetical protein